MRWSQHLSIAAKGFVMGAADIVPGVSGGTMALVLGIYQRWINAIRSFDNVWLSHIWHLRGREIVSYPHLSFLIPLLLGIVAALMFFTRVIPLPNLLHSHPELIYSLFFGLIIGSVIILLRQTGMQGKAAFAWVLLGITLAWLVVTRVPMNSPDTPVFIFLSGFIAISAMLLPGLSGSFILLILHKYDTILGAIGRLDLMILLPFMFGALLGLIVFSRFLSWLLSRYYQASLQMITGILIGSLWVIWPFQQRVYIVIHEKQKLLSSTPLLPESWLHSQTLLAITIALFGCFLVLWLNYLSTKNNP